MAAVVRVPLADISNFPHLARKQTPKRVNPFDDKENIDPLSVEGFMLFGLSSCPTCRALFPAAEIHTCASAAKSHASGRDPNAARIKKPNLRNL